jgi:photosystem II stability/assembly factor-like uncharacterized protein
MNAPRAFRMAWLGLATLALTGCGPREAPLLYPRPQGGPLVPGEQEEEEEEGGKERRRAWFEHRHQAGPEVDWREVERRNGEAQIAKRNRIGRSAFGQASRWVERGSQNQAGRVHTAALSSDGLALYVGTSLGGLWRGSLDGENWTPLGDNLYGGVHHMAVVPGAGPADPDAILAASNGGLIHVTRDEGATWQVPTGLGAAVNSVRRVLRASDGSETVFLVRRNSGVYNLMRSTDGLASFQSVLSMSTFAGDAWIRRDGGNDLFAVTASGIRRSTDQGDTWTVVASTPGSGTSAELTGSEAGAPRLWVARGGSLYRSDDAGSSWSNVHTLNTYWGRLCASAVDADRLCYGGVEVYRTTDGGASFGRVNGWAEYYGNPATRLHADIMGLDVVAGLGPQGETWYVSTDGGLYRSETRMASVENLSLSGLRVSQYYTTHTSAANPVHVVAGAQDQGYQRAGSGPIQNTGLVNLAQLISGDYGHLTSGNGAHDFLYSVYPGFVLAQLGENNPNLHQISFPGSEDHAWMPPVVADPLAPSDFFLCASHLYRYDKGVGASWAISQWSPFDFGASAGEYVSALTFSPADVQRAYAVTDRGRLFHSSDQGLTWTISTSTGPGGQYFYGTALLADSSDPDTVVVAGSGYSGPAVYRSVDGGVSFAPWSDGLPPTLVYCLGEAADGSGTLFCGTETAAYRRDPGAGAWVDITGNEAPITIYWSVEALPDQNTVRFGTYGRGIWDYQLDYQARAFFRNGSGLNAPCLSSSNDPVLGTTWNASIDGDAHLLALQAILAIRDGASPGVVRPYGEVLLAGSKVFSFSKPHTPGPIPFDLPIPADVGLAGVQVHSQGVLFGNGIQLCNALDLTLGF